jgi:hypothetical protein
MYSEEPPPYLDGTVRARAAVRAAIAAAEAVVASALEADFAAWTAQPEPEAGI